VTTAFAQQARMLRGWVWSAYFEGLTDDELHWEPAPGMWGMRLKSEVRTDRTADEVPPGDYWVDTFRDAPDPPLTTIAWRLAHLTLGTWNWNGFLADVPAGPEPALRHDAAGALELWRAVLDRFVDVVRSLPEERLAERSTAWGGEATFANVASHVTLEIAYHSAEIGTMRHLYRAMR
jgi:hypothetical protein